MNSKKHLTTLIFFLVIFNSQSYFSQNKIQEALNKSQKEEQEQRDSLLKLISFTKNDTLRADLYFEFFELTNVRDWFKYSQRIITSSDSLVKTTASPVMRNALLNRIAQAKRYCYYYYNDTEGPGSKTGLELLNEAIKIYTQTKNAEQLIITYLNLSDYYFKQGKMLLQLQAMQDGLKYMTDCDFKRGISRFYVRLQFFYADLGDTAQALSYLEKGLALEKKINDPTRLATGYYIAGVSFSKMKKHIKAIDYLLLAIKTFENDSNQQQQKYREAHLLLGEEYLKIKEYTKALSTFDRTIVLSEKVNDVRGIFLGTLAKGKTFSMMGDFEKAIAMHKDVLKLAEDSETDDAIRMCSWELAQDYYRNSDYTKARKYITLSLKFARKNGVIITLFENEELAYRIDSAGRYFEGAFEHYQAYLSLKEKMSQDEVKKLAAQNKFQSEMEIQKAEERKKDAVHEEESKRQKIIFFSVLGCLLLVVLLAAMIFKNLKQSKNANKIIELQKHLVEEKQKEILDSINYAKRLQDAILPPIFEIKENLPESFVLFKPKDIVAGDFYWADKIENYYFIAAADCTGHGVPGAMVSMVCSNALNRTVNEFDIKETGKILDKVRELVLETFKKSEENVKDGMDISLCRIDKTTNEVQWSGAYNPLWYFKANELIEIKADKQPIGKYDDPKPFATHTLQLTPNTNLYMFTDGYADQFSPADKKMTKKKFKEIVISSQGRTLNEQKQIIDDFFINWQGNNEQIDDVLVIGIRV